MPGIAPLVVAASVFVSGAEPPTSAWTIRTTEHAAFVWVDRNDGAGERLAEAGRVVLLVDEREFVKTALPGVELTRLDEGLWQAEATAPLSLRGLALTASLLPGISEVRPGAAFSIGRPEVRRAPARSPEPQFAHLKATSSTGTDPFVGDQWFLKNDGRARGEVGADVGALDALAANPVQRDVVVGIIGSGIDWTHPDLTNQLWINQQERFDGRDTDGNGWVDDVIGINARTGNGHEVFDHWGFTTAVAGVILAEAGNGVGGAGIAPMARLMTCRLYDEDGYTSWLDVLRCAEYFADMKRSRGENIAVVVWDIDPQLVPEEPPEATAAIRVLAEAGILVTASSRSGLPGDISIDGFPDYPASGRHPNLLAAFPTDRRDGTMQNILPGRRTLMIGAPGVQLLTTAVGYTVPLDEPSALAAWDFADDADGWTFDGNLSVEPDAQASGGRVVRVIVDDDSRQLDHWKVASLTSPPIDLSAHVDTPLVVAVRASVPVLDGLSQGRVGGVRVEFVTDADSVVLTISEQYGIHAAIDYNATIAPHQWARLGGATAVRVRVSYLVFPWAIDWIPPAVIDGIAVVPEPPWTGSNRYTLLHGTGAAAAVVAGVAAALAATSPEPLSAAGLRNLLLSSGTPVFDPATAHWVPWESGRRVTLWDGSGHGALQCGSRPYFAVTWPRGLRQFNAVQADDVAAFEAWGVDCAVGAEPDPIVDPVTGSEIRWESFEAVGGHWADGGRWRLPWRPQGYGDRSLVVGGRRFHALVLAPFAPFEEIPFEWRDDAPRLRERWPTPFALRFTGMRTGIAGWPMSWGSQGGATWHPQMYDPEKSGVVDVPHAGNFLGHCSVFPPYQVIALLPLAACTMGWDDTNWIRGEAPYREWVFQWTDERLSGCAVDVAFDYQLVLFEHKPDVEFHYRRVATPCAESSSINVAAVINRDRFTAWEGRLRSGMALRTRPVGMPNTPPAKVAEIGEITVARGGSVSRDLGQYFADADGDILEFSAVGLPPGITLDRRGRLSGTAWQAGTQSATVTVEDGYGGKTSADVAFAIGQGSSPPGEGAQPPPTNPPPVSPPSSGGGGRLPWSWLLLASGLVCIKLHRRA